MRFLPFRIDTPQQAIAGELHAFVQSNEFDHPKHLQDEIAGNVLGAVVALRQGYVYVSNSIGPLLKIKPVC